MCRFAPQTMSVARILVVDATPSQEGCLASILREGGYSVVSARTSTEALAQLDHFMPDLTFLDMRLPDVKSTDLMRQFLDASPETKIISTASGGTIVDVVEWMRAGAYDCMVKPISTKSLLSSVDRALSVSRKTYGATVPVNFEDMIGSSSIFRSTLAAVRKVCHSNSAVFLTGESGTGKSTAAWAIHTQSSRAKRSFVRIDCATFACATTVKEFCARLTRARLATSEGGTLFLDNVCDLDSTLQPRLLEFVENTADASSSEKEIVRFICATRLDPLDEIRKGRLRSDLFYRLFILPIHMPSLRSRGRDVVEIAEHKLTTLSKNQNRSFVGLSSEVEDLFLSLSWPGNILELHNILQNIVTFNDAKIVTKTMIPEAVLRYFDATLNAQHEPANFDKYRGKTLSEIERIAIEHTLADNDGSVPKAASALGVSPSTIYRKLESWRQEDAEQTCPK